MPKPEEKRPVATGFRTRNFWALFSGLVVIIDAAVGGVAEAVEAVRDVAERQRGVEDVGGFRSAVRGVDHVEAVAGGKPGLVVHVEGEDVDEVLDDVGRHAERETVPPKAVVKGGKEARLLRLLLGDREHGFVDGRLLRRDVEAVVGERDGRDMTVVRLVEADADRTDRAGLGIRSEPDAHFLPGAEIEGEIGDQRRLDGDRGVRIGAFVHQQFAKRSALGDEQDLVLDA